MSTVWAIFVLVGAGVPPLSSEAPAQLTLPAQRALTPVCIGSTVDPLSYRANPEVARHSKILLEQLESQVSHQLSDALRSQSGVSEDNARLVSALEFRPYSVSAGREIGKRVECGAQGVQLDVATAFLPKPREWSLAIYVRGPTGKKILRYRGRDEYVECRECLVDGFGGITHAISSHGRDFLLAIKGVTYDK